MRLYVDVDKPADATLAARKAVAYFVANPNARMRRPQEACVSLIWEDGEPTGPPSYQLVIWGTKEYPRVRIWRVFPGSLATRLTEPRTG